MVQPTRTSSPTSGTFISMAARVEGLQTDVDHRIADRLQRLGHVPTCAAGCAACCRQLVLISPGEAQAIRDFIRSRQDLWETLEPRVERWEQAVNSDSELSEMLLDLDYCEGFPDPEEGARMELLYWERRLDCPFLVEERCSIYPVRPFSCREHLVISDPRLCSESLDLPQTAGSRFEYRLVATFAGEALFGLQNAIIPLPVAVRSALSELAEDPSPILAEAADQWVETAKRKVRIGLAQLGIA